MFILDIKYSTEIPVRVRRRTSCIVHSYKLYFNNCFIFRSTQIKRIQKYFAKNYHFGKKNKFTWNSLTFFPESILTEIIHQQLESFFCMLTACFLSHDLLETVIMLFGRCSLLFPYFQIISCPELRNRRAVTYNARLNPFKPSFRGSKLVHWKISMLLNTC